MTPLIDTHTHLYDEAFRTDVDEVVQRALQAGVGLMLLPAIDSSSHHDMLTLCSRYPALFRPMMGLHPTSVALDVESQLGDVYRRLHSGEAAYVGVGEIGLDLYHDTTYREQQEMALRQQLDWAEELSLPVSIHARNAYAELMALLTSRSTARYKGVLHCFSGSVDDARLAVEMGFALGIGGVLTFRKSTLPEVVKAIPLDHLLLETDAPYLAPVPHRGKRNESAFLPLVAQTVAELKGVSVEEVAERTSAVACRLFHLSDISQRS